MKAFLRSDASGGAFYNCKDLPKQFLKDGKQGFLAPYVRGARGDKVNVMRHKSLSLKQAVADFTPENRLPKKGMNDDREVEAQTAVARTKLITFSLFKNYVPSASTEGDIGDFALQFPSRV